MIFHGVEGSDVGGSYETLVNTLNVTRRIAPEAQYQNTAYSYFLLRLCYSSFIMSRHFEGGIF
jgi:hypothetical protein